MNEHPIKQEIKILDIEKDDGYTVGQGGITKIEACEKSGMHANIPYIRVWVGENCVAEFCQHNILGIYFKS